MSNKGVEVFRILDFDCNKNYEFAFYTTREGRWPNEKYFTTEPLKFLGKYCRSERWGGFGDGAGGAEVFVHNGTENRVVYDYEGKTCFREVETTTQVNSSE
jgi:hypothetical protein